MNNKTKRLIIDLSVTAILVGGNIVLWLVGKKSGEQLYWVAFMLVWFNLALSWLTRNNHKPIYYLFLATSFIIEILILINIYWISTRLM